MHPVLLEYGPLREVYHVYAQVLQYLLNQTDA